MKTKKPMATCKPLLPGYPENIRDQVDNHNSAFLDPDTQPDVDDRLMFWSIVTSLIFIWGVALIVVLGE